MRSSLSWPSRPALPLQRLAGQVLAADLQRLAALLGQLGVLLLQLLDLQLQALAGGRHVGHPAAHLLQHLQLALVGVVQGLTRILQTVQRLVRLGLEDHRHSLHHAHRAAPVPS